MSLFTALFSAIALATTGVSAPADSPTPHGVWPVEPHVVERPFEPPTDVFSSGHRGVDLVGALGTPVVTSLAGTVTFAGIIAGRGVVVVNHGDTRTTYEPVLAEVHQGDAVESGAQIGSLDIVQSHCFPSACLHWGWLRGDLYLDPLQLVEDAPQVRLLPLTPAGAPDDRQP